MEVELHTLPLYTRVHIQTQWRNHSPSYEEGVIVEHRANNRVRVYVSGHNTSGHNLHIIRTYYTNGVRVGKNWERIVSVER